MYTILELSMVIHFKKNNSIYNTKSHPISYLCLLCVPTDGVDTTLYMYLCYYAV